MVKIRLARGGKKNDPIYRIVALDSRSKREGGTLEILGNWHPKSESLKINEKGIKKWVSRGAQVSSAVQKLIDKK